MSAALKPLILEIQSLKTEVSSLKKERNTTKLVQNPSIYVQKIGNDTHQTNIQKLEIPSKSIQKTTKKTFTEIAKINETLSKQSIKLNK